MKDYIAHSKDDKVPKEPYETHAKKVDQKALQILLNIKPYMKPDMWDKLYRIVRPAAPPHDLGKLIDDDQIYLKADDDFRKNCKMTNHTDAGTAMLIRERHFVSAACVRAHHIGFCDYSSTTLRDKSPVRNRSPWVVKLYKIPEDFTMEQLTDKYLDEMIRIHNQLVKPDPLPEPVKWKEAPPELWRLALSILVYADHHATSDNYQSPTIEKTEFLKPEKRLFQLDEYVRKLQETAPKNKRNRLKQKVYDACRHSPVKSLFSYCGAEVGLGKTTAMMAYALAQNPRSIIYVAAFTAIIGQTVDTYIKALGLPDDIAPFIGRHDFQTDYSKEDLTSPLLRALYSEEADLGKVRKLFSTTWSCPITCTTAIQFCETLCACRPGRLKKFVNLIGAHIIIDESHICLPMAMWPLFLKQLTFLVEHMGCRVTFGSGSLVKVWDIKEIRELSEFNYEVESIMPKTLSDETLEMEKNRVRMNYDNTSLTCNGLCNRILAQKGSRLAVFETVRNSAIVAKAMRKLGLHTEDIFRTYCDRYSENFIVDDEKRVAATIEQLMLRTTIYPCKPLIFHLSTVLSPEEREDVLRVICALLKKEPDANIILIGTSCLEVGIDFSFHHGFRERSGLLNILQFRGRIRRNDEPEWDDATVEVFALDYRLKDPTRFQDPYSFTRNNDMVDAGDIFHELYLKGRANPEDCDLAADMEVDRKGLTFTIQTKDDKHEGHEKSKIQVTAQELLEDEKKLRFFTVDSRFHVIAQEKFVAIVDTEALKKGSFNKSEIFRKSVQIFWDRFNKCPVEPVDKDKKLDGFFVWKGKYDKFFLGYMAEYLP